MAQHMAATTAPATLNTVPASDAAVQGRSASVVAGTATLSQRPTRRAPPRQANRSACEPERPRTQYC